MKGKHKTSLLGKRPPAHRVGGCACASVCPTNTRLLLIRYVLEERRPGEEGRGITRHGWASFSATLCMKARWAVEGSTTGGRCARFPADRSPRDLGHVARLLSAFSACETGSRLLGLWGSPTSWCCLRQWKNTPSVDEGLPRREIYRSRARDLGPHKLLEQDPLLNTLGCHSAWLTRQAQPLFTGGMGGRRQPPSVGRSYRRGSSYTAPRLICCNHHLK